MDSGLARNVPTIVVNSRRHHAFIRSRNNCPANIRHQLLKMLDVDCDAPRANATGAVNTSTPSRPFKIAQLMMIRLSHERDSCTVRSEREKFISSRATDAHTTAAMVEMAMICE